MREIFKTVFGGRGSVVINGSVYEGQNISVVNGQVTVDGVVQGALENYNVSIHVQGNPVEVSSASGRIHVSGSVAGSVQTASGDISCEDVGGSVTTMSGDVECGNIRGSVTTMSGDVTQVFNE